METFQPLFDSSQAKLNQLTPSNEHSLTASDLSIKKERGPPSLRKKQSQRFTVAHNTSLEPPPPLPAYSSQNSLHHHLQNTDRTPSISSVSDSDYNPSPEAVHPTPYMSTSSNSSNGQYATTPYVTSSNITRTNTSVSGNHLNAIGTPLIGNSNPAGAESDDDIIPTAIVIKNIPFSVRREQLLAILDDLMVPAPYAFNYHFDNGVFRGLAFANFRSASEADAAVAGLNGFDISGRKLRVEYKKVLQAGEKERIEKEKAIKRMRSMQLQKDSMFEQYSQQGPPLSSASNNPTSFAYHQAHEDNVEDDFRSQIHHGNLSVMQQHALPSSIPNRPPASVLNLANHHFQAANQWYDPAATQHTPESGMPGGVDSRLSVSSSNKELDMNDPQTLELYSRIVVFKEDNFRDEFAFAKSLSSVQRRIVHQIAKKLGLEHRSEGLGDDRFVVVSKVKRPAGRTMSRMASSTHMNRSAASSAQFGSAHGSSLGMSSAALRIKKSMPDMRVREQEGAARQLGVRKSTVNLRESGTRTHHFTPPLPTDLEGQFSSLLISPPVNNNFGSHLIRQPKGPEPSALKGFGVKVGFGGASRLGSEEETEEGYGRFGAISES